MRPSRTVCTLSLTKPTFELDQSKGPTPTKSGLKWLEELRQNAEDNIIIMLVEALVLSAPHRPQQFGFS